jgi:predicted GNAT family acetyltransferase
MPQTLSPQMTYIARNRIAIELYQKLGFQPKSFNCKTNLEIKGS